MTRAVDKPKDPHPPPPPRNARFAALRSRNLRLFLIGQVFTTTGLWVQRIAQDWLVLTLTGSATAVGITTALQWAPMLVFGMVGGWVADHYPKRRVLQATQTAAAAVAVSLAVLTLTHHVTAWHVQLLAAALGTIAAIEKPVRQAFVTDLVETEEMRTAISLTYSVFYLGNFAGPALSGLLITAIGPGWSFALNALAYVAPLIALARIDVGRRPLPHPVPRAAAPTQGALRSLLRRPEIWRPIVVGGAFGMFTLNLPVILTTYASAVHYGPAGYALLSSSLALGSMLGGLISAGRTNTTLRSLTFTGYAFAGMFTLAAVMPTPWSFACALAAVGVISTLLFTSTNATVQLSAGHALRGRVMGVYLLVETGTAAIGGPILGIVVQHLGHRMGMVLAGLFPALVLVLISLVSFTIRTTAPTPSEAHSGADPAKDERPHRTLWITPGLLETVGSGEDQRYGWSEEVSG